MSADPSGNRTRKEAEEAILMLCVKNSNPSMQSAYDGL